MSEMIETGVNEEVVADPQKIATETTAVEETGTEQANETGTADQGIPDGNKPSTAWADMRRKAKEADELKIKLEKLSKGLPDGYRDIDEYIDFIDKNDFEQPTRSTTQPVENIEQIAKKVIESLPEFRNLKEQERNRYLVDGFNSLQKEFPEIKKAEDVPLKVWESWDEGKKDGKSLIDHYNMVMGKELRQKAYQQGVNQAKAEVMGTAHTSQVQGTTAKTDYENIEVPDEMVKKFNSIGITDPKKQKEYYVKHKER